MSEIDRPLLQLDRVCVIREGAQLLRDVSMTVRGGDGWLITGGNGAGKSTLLAVLGGRLWPAPERGVRVYDFGRGPEGDAVTAQQEVALVGPALQQDYHRFDWNFRVADVVLSGVQRAPVPQRRATPAQRERVRALLAEHELSHLAPRRLLSLSSGEQRAVLILRALAGEPALLLLDEIFESLDAARRARLAAMLRRLHTAGQTLIAAQPQDAPELSFLSRRLHLVEGRGMLVVPPASKRPVEATLLPPVSRAAVEAMQPLPAAKSAAEAMRPRSPVSRPAGEAASVQPPDGRPLLELRDVSVSPGDQRVLHALRWTLRRGERWRLRGPNGAGKSTLLRLLHGDFWPELGGELRWHIHRRDAGVWALRRRVRLVSPLLQTQYHAATRVLDCVLSGHVAGIGVTGEVGDEQRGEAHEVLARFGLEGRAGWRLGQLSHGQQRRVLIARMLVGRPELLLLDEPCGGLDEEARGMLHEVLLALVQRGATLVMASHEHDPPPELFTHEMHLERGRIVRQGPL